MSIKPKPIGALFSFTVPSFVFLVFVQTLLEMRSIVALLATAISAVVFPNANTDSSDSSTALTCGSIETMRVVSQDGTVIYGEGIGNHHGAHLLLAHGFAASAEFFDALFQDCSLTSKLYMVRTDIGGF
jgi:hypothetical protein